MIFPSSQPGPPDLLPAHSTDTHGRLAAATIGSQRTHEPPAEDIAEQPTAWLRSLAALLSCIHHVLQFLTPEGDTQQPALIAANVANFKAIGAPEFMQQEFSKPE